jgi:hypothetical protein
VKLFWILASLSFKYQAFPSYTKIKWGWMGEGGVNNIIIYNIYNPSMQIILFKKNKKYAFIY